MIPLPAKTWNIEKEPPGMKENGGIFMHLNAWLVESWCRAGRGREAAALYRKTLPENLSENRDIYRWEPFVYPEYVRASKETGFGRGGHTWLTGTAPTMLWKEFTMVRNFRGAVYHIRFLNPDEAETGTQAYFDLMMG